MRFATLIHEPELRDRVGDALVSVGIEVLNLESVNALIADLHTQAFAVSVVEYHVDRIGHWLAMLQAHADEPIVLIAIGTGGAAGMSRALLHGADDYAVMGHGAEQLVHRVIARACGGLGPTRSTFPEAA